MPAVEIRNRVQGLRYVHARDLLDNFRNFRTHPRAQRAALLGVLGEIGIADALIAYETPLGLQLIDGHLRKDAAPDTLWPVLVLDVSEAEANALLATLDPLAALAGTDTVQLEALLAQVQTGSAAVQALLDGLAESAGIVRDAGGPVGDDELPDMPDDGPTRVQPGEVWQLGRHRIACIDSTDAAQIKDFIASDTVAMVWADPPYGISIVDVKGFVGGGAAYDIPFGGVKTETAAARAKRLGSSHGAKPFGSAHVRGSDGASNMVAVGLYAPVIGDETTDTAVNAARVSLALFPTSIQFWWGANNYAFALPGSTCWIVWDKRNTGNFADAELAWSNHKSAVRIFVHQWSGLIKESERNQKRVHPTQKPVALAVWAFEKYGALGDVIFDPFLGSGMSVLAAEQTGRTVLGCELSPQYCDVTIIRWETATGQTAHRLD